MSLMSVCAQTVVPAIAMARCAAAVAPVREKCSTLQMAARFTTVSSMKISSRTAASAIKCHVTFGVQQEIRNIPMRNLSRISP